MYYCYMLPYSSAPLTSVWNTCEMHLKYVQDASGMHVSRTRMRCIRASAKSHNKALQQDLHNCHALFCQTQDVSRMHERRVRNSCRMHPECVQDVSWMRVRMLPWSRAVPYVHTVCKISYKRCCSLFISIISTI